MTNQTQQKMLFQAKESGFSLVEVMASFLVIAVISMAIMKNTVTALSSAKLAEVNHAASSLAISKMEELSSVDTRVLDASYNGVELAVAWPDLNGITFERSTTVTVAADESRKVEVIVTSNSAKLPTSVMFDTTFVPWE
ncbi:MAG: prepilin-type N-terminal cleavage/methylation domain-containing protein [bacterium]|nr:prepilin-type N-terminal cleavage/methylation domain-containing protein [bacterium]